MDISVRRVESQLETENFIKKLFDSFYKQHEFTIKFGDYKENLKDFICKNTPYAKAGVLSLEDSFSKIGKQLTLFLKSLEIKPVSFVYSTPPQETIESAAGLFQLPEDVRLLIVTDSSLLPFAQYFCTVKKICLIFIPTTANFSGAFNKNVFIKTEDNLDCINVKKNTFTLIDFSIIDPLLDECFEKSFSRFISVFDYLINRVLSGKKPIEKLIGIYNRLVLSFDFSNLSKENVVCFAIKTEALLSLMEQVSYFGADVFALKLVKKPNKGFSLAIALALSKIYSLVGVSDIPLFNIENYSARADKVSLLTGVNSQVILENFKEQNQNFAKYGELAKERLFAFAKDYKNLQALEENILNAYYQLGGAKDFEKKNNEALKKVINYLGDTPFYCNCPAFLRELGILKI